MLKTSFGFKGCVTAPHQVASKAGVEVLEQGGTAIEAMVAAAATIAVVYPHMNSIGGDGFWIIKRQGEAPFCIEGCGQAAGLASKEWYQSRGHVDAIPARGGEAALTVPGTIGGWQKALGTINHKAPLPLSVLLKSAITYAENGIAVTASQANCTGDKLDGLKDVTGFSDVFLDDGKVHEAGDRLCQPALAKTLRYLAEQGLEAFYNGDVATEHDAFLKSHESPLRAEDFVKYAPKLTEPLRLKTSLGHFYNTQPPTQGMASLMILGLFDRLNVENSDSFEHLHGLIEATKQAFQIRNSELGDPLHMTRPAQDFLSDEFLEKLSTGIDIKTALPWPHPLKPGDTIWMGACDSEGTMVSFIQSVFWEFGSGLTCPATGVFFQNRGAGFSLAGGPNGLEPGKRPFHTLNPAFAELNDGRLMVYGTMGGDGQPQTQAALLTRYAAFGGDLQEAITAPRWLLGKTWGSGSTSLKIESNMSPAVIEALKTAGHAVELVDPLNEMMGHAGAIVLHDHGLIEGANDPRSDGLALIV